MSEITELFMQDFKWFEKLFCFILQISIVWILRILADGKTETGIRRKAGIGDEGLCLEVNGFEACENVIESHMRTSFDVVLIIIRGFQ
jgi:hypothetical protein